jgi:hypothetical protein
MLKELNKLGLQTRKSCCNKPKLFTLNLDVKFVRTLICAKNAFSELDMSMTWKILELMSSLVRNLSLFYVKFN